MERRSSRRRRQQLEPRHRDGGRHPLVAEGSVAVPQVLIEQVPAACVALLRVGGGSRHAGWPEAVRAHTCEVAVFAEVAAVGAVRTHGSGGNCRGMRTMGPPAAQAAVTMAGP